MAHPAPRLKIEIDCVHGEWEPMDGGVRDRFRGMVRYTITALEHPENPVIAFETRAEWVQPTPPHHRDADPVPPVVAESSEEEDPSEDGEFVPNGDIQPHPAESGGDWDPEVDPPSSSEFAVVPDVDPSVSETSSVPSDD
jgi:hypothetical protein